MDDDYGDGDGNGVEIEVALRGGGEEWWLEMAAFA